MLFLQHYWTVLLLNACPTNYRKLLCRNTSTWNHIYSSFCQYASPAFFFPILLGSCNTRQTSLIKLHYKFHYKTKTVIPKLEISFEFGLAFYILLDTWLTFAICSLMLWESSFEAKLLNLRLKWLLRNLTLSLLSSFQVKMVNKGSDLVTFVIFSVVRKMKILQNLFKSWSSHNISNALLPMKLFTCPTIFYFIKNS